ncbi:structural maintenance of chromosomes protein 4-like [Magnolia sinica]|uniref:structural maintenance of chromosomes protein 4-like n=1 Tax=Magnolia sinica TaxID=86752 RepID=UPI002657C955|nr:structural maintenance of chromosomes protein 4-like [Magnolia sinica]
MVGDFALKKQMLDDRRFSKTHLNLQRRLQDDGIYEAVAGSDFVIIRVAFLDNSSKYYINDRRSNFTEVTKELKGKGVDLDNNRFLILQGEVEQIYLMKPKARMKDVPGHMRVHTDLLRFVLSTLL